MSSNFVTKTILQFRLKSVHHYIIEDACKTFLEAAKKLNFSPSGAIPLPTRIRRWNVLRSSFKHKKAQDAFEIRTHSRLISVPIPTDKVQYTNRFIEYVREIIPDIQIDVKSKTIHTPVSPASSLAPAQPSNYSAQTPFRFVNDPKEIRFLYPLPDVKLRHLSFMPTTSPIPDDFVFKRTDVAETLAEGEEAPPTIYPDEFPVRRLTHLFKKPRTEEDLIFEHFANMFKMTRRRYDKEEEEVGSVGVIPPELELDEIRKFVQFARSEEGRKVDIDAVLESFVFPQDAVRHINAVADGEMDAKEVTRLAKAAEQAQAEMQAQADALPDEVLDECLAEEEEEEDDFERQLEELSKVTAEANTPPPQQQ